MGQLLKGEMGELGGRTEDEAVRVGLNVARQADGLESGRDGRRSGDDDDAHDPVDDQAALRRLVDVVPADRVVLFPYLGPGEDLGLADDLLDCCCAVSALARE